MEEFTVTALEELEGHELAAFAVSGNRIAIATVEGLLRVRRHLHASGVLACRRGAQGTTVTCPCHGSEFNVTTGDVLRGPAREPVRSYPVRLEDGALRVEV